MNNNDTDTQILNQFYRVLHVQTDVTINDLRKAYYRLAKRFHPDKNLENNLVAKDHFIKISKAYQTLYNELNVDPNLGSDHHHHHNNTKTNTGTETGRNFIWEQFSADLKDNFLDNSDDNDGGDSREVYRNLPIDQLINRLLQTKWFTNCSDEQQSKSSNLKFDRRRRFHSGPPNSMRNCQLEIVTRRENEDCNQPTIPLNSTIQTTNLNSNHSDEETNSNQPESDIVNWIDEQKNLLDSLKIRRKSTLTCRKSNCNPLVDNLPINNPDLLPVLDCSDVLRCSHCYRTFNLETALKHVELCARKNQSQYGQTLVSLGSTVATGYGSSTNRAKQYVNDLQKRKSTGNFPTSTSNYHKVEKSDLEKNEITRSNKTQLIPNKNRTNEHSKKINQQKSLN